MDDDLGVGARREDVATVPKSALKIAIVVDLSVEDDVESPILVGDGLMAAVEIDDRQPANAETDRSVDVIADVVRSAVDDRRTHSPNGLGIDWTLSLGVDDAADSTHQKPSPQSRPCPARLRLGAS
jgi:hypothetical protein